MILYQDAPFDLFTRLNALLNADDMIQEELKRFDRTLAILVLLQSGKLVKAHQLSVRFGVSLRTIYRDIHSLVSAGIPVIGEAGIGYTMMEGYRLPPVMLTQEEAGSLVAAEKLMYKFTDPGMGAYFESAMNKVRSVLRGSEKDWLSLLESKVFARSGKEELQKKIPHALEILFNSIAGQTQVYMEYHARTAAKPSARYIEPVGVFHEGAHWYLYAFCLLRNDYRQFRTDRIKSIQKTDSPFIKKHDEIKDFGTHIYSGPEIKVTIAVKKEVLPFIRDDLKNYGLTREEEKEDEVILEFQSYGSSEGLARWYLMFGDYARILAPDNFMHQVKELAEKTLRRLCI